MSEANSTQSANKAARTLKTSGTLRLLNRVGVFLMVGVLVLVGAAVFREKFLSVANGLTVLRSVTLIAMVAMGVSFITYGGHYVDLSIPNMIALVGFVTVSTLHWGLGISLACGLGVGMAVGLVNGYIVGYLRLNPIIWTLAMNFMLAGFIKLLFAGQAYPDTDPGTSGHLFLQLSEYELPGRIPLATVVLAAMVPVAGWLMKRTRFGNQIQQTGSAYEVARLSGVDVRRTVLMTFAVSALTASMAAIFLASGSRSATFELGSGYDFSAITAVVLGGVLLSGGTGSGTGVIGGVMVIGLLDNLVSQVGKRTVFGMDRIIDGGLNNQMVVKGCVFVLVVALTSWFARKGGQSRG